MDARRIEHIHKEASEERRTLRGGDGLSSHFAGLCLELLEHVAKQGAQVSRLQAQLQSASYREVLNLRARIARLTPLEFLLAKGGDPMAQMAEAIRELSDKLNRSERAGSKVPMAPHVFAQMVNRVRDLAFDFGTSEQFRDRVADLLGKYINVEHGSKGEPEQTEVPAVVVPAWDVNAFALACVKEGAYAEGDLRDAIKNAEMGYNFAISSARAIPADRVLGEGMMAVKWISVNDALPEDGQTVGFVTECANDKWYHGRVLGGRYMAEEFGGFSVPGLMVQASHWFAFPPLPDALRANQGGAAR